MQHITLPVFSDDGRLASREVLEVDIAAPKRYRLLHSPAFVDGLATGDVIEVDESLRSGFRLVLRARNLAVIVAFKKHEDTSSSQSLRLKEAIQTIGGMVDGGPARMLVFTIPVRVGFQTVESLLAEFMRELPGSSWWYGNVYEAGDPARPLDWWKESE
jgi:Domain of unknown function (DUF4265)